MDRDRHPLRQYRDDNGISLAKLAADVGTTRQSLFRIETGDNQSNLHWRFLARLSTDGKLSANDFLPPAPPEQSTPQHAESERLAT
jgi:DNA-binding XRE family transcriptional regulator